MGDHGKLYRRITDAHIDAMKRLASRADVLLPNLTEAAAMTGIPYREQTDEAYLESLLDGLLDLGAKATVITGVHLRDNAIGFYGRQAGQDSFSYQGELIPRQCHGTGDLFAAVLTGSLLQKKPEAARANHNGMCNILYLGGNVQSKAVPQATEKFVAGGSNRFANFADDVD
jgi:pyridoxine kinase